MMFGYVTINQDELKVKDVKRYRAFYCGLCRELQERHGILSQTTLTYDMTFLAVLLTGLYEENVRMGQERCMLHPVKKHTVFRNQYVAYAADMNLLLCYYNFLDDWFDEKKFRSLAMTHALHESFEEICVKYPRQVLAVRSYVRKLRVCERENSDDIDRGAGLTGEVMAEIFVCHEDVWADTLRKLGFYLGKFIYLMDAFDDLEKDQKSGNYNPWMKMAVQEDFPMVSEQILTMMMGECARQFEKLPILEYVDILRNVVYSGIWTKYDYIRKKKEDWENTDDGSISRAGRVPRCQHGRDKKGIPDAEQKISSGCQYQQSE